MVQYVAARNAARTPGIASNARSGHLGKAEVDPRLDPRRRALVKLHLVDIFNDLGHYLDGTGPGSDDRHSFPGQVNAVVPLRGVKHRAVEVADARDSGSDGMCSAPAPEMRNCATYSCPSR